MRITLGTTLLLGLLAAVGPISTDIYLPAFALIDHEFARPGAAQITLAAWFAGLAIGQMLQGSLSDRVGRRLPLLIGTLIYAAASFGCALAPGLVSFSTCRLIAALSGSASMVVPRAVVRDITDGISAARMLSRLSLVTAVVPILAPALGGIALAYLSWRDLFWAAGLYGLVGALLVWRFLPDTLPPERRLRQSTTQTLARYIHIATEPVFLTNALMGSFVFSALFAYIGGSAAVYTGFFHLSPRQYGMLFGLNAAGLIGASQFAAPLAARLGVTRVLHAAAIVLFAAYAAAAATALLHTGLAVLAIPIFLGNCAIGLMSPLITMNALTLHRAHAGSASALMGTWQFSLAAFAGVLVGASTTGCPVPMTLLMASIAAIALLTDRLRPSPALQDPQ